MERPPRRKLLVASIGVATVSYALVTTACGGGRTGGNLMPPPDRGDGGIPSPAEDAASPSSSPAASGSAAAESKTKAPDPGPSPIAGNLTATPDKPDAGPPAKPDAGAPKPKPKK